MRCYLAEHYGDLASVLGLLVAIVGFVVIIKDVRKAERAAEEARRVTKEALNRLRWQDFVHEISMTLQMAREMHSACREKVWGTAMNRCDDAGLRIARLQEHPRMAPEREMLAELVKTMRDLSLYLEAKQHRTPSPNVSKQRSAEVLAVIAALTQLHARIQAATEES